MTEAEFHKARRMYAVLSDGTVLLAPEGSDRTHEQWLITVGPAATVADVMENRTRGYVLGSRLAAYQGRDFEVPDRRADVVPLLKLFPNVVVVCLGAKPDPSQNPWPARQVIGVGDFLRRSGGALPKKDALVRAQELLLMPVSQLPGGARVVRDALARRVGICIETCQTAFAWYAQAAEGLPCDDDLYRLPQGEREWVASLLRIDNPNAAPVAQHVEG